MKNIFLLIGLFSLSSLIKMNPLYASNAAASAEAAKTAEGESSHGAEAKEGTEEAAPTAESSGKARVNIKEWIEVEAKLSALKSKVEAQHNIVLGLLAEKKAATDQNQAASVATRLSKAHSELQALIKDYEKQRSLLKFQYPEKGLTKERTYERIEVKSIEEMELQMTTEGRLKKAVNKMRSQYSSKGNNDEDEDQKKKKIDPQTLQKKPDRELPVQKNNLTESIILSK